MGLALRPLELLTLPVFRRWGKALHALAFAKLTLLVFLRFSGGDFAV